MFSAETVELRKKTLGRLALGADSRRPLKFLDHDYRPNQRTLETEGARVSVFQHNLPSGNMALTAPMYAGIERHQERAGRANPLLPASDISELQALRASRMLGHQARRPASRCPVSRRPTTTRAARTTRKVRTMTTAE
jgi:hypothetical protein